MPSELNFRANIFGMKMLGVERDPLRQRGGLAPRGLQAARHRRARPVLRPHQGPHQHVLRPRPRGARRLSRTRSAACCRPSSRRAPSGVGATVHRGGTYVCMEGPQFSTVAESNAYRQWGMDIIGMTNLQEAKLAREAEICYVDDCARDRLRLLAPRPRLGHGGDDHPQPDAERGDGQQVIADAVTRVPAERTCPCAGALATAIITRPDAVPADQARARADRGQVPEVMPGLTSHECQPQ